MMESIKYKVVSSKYKALDAGGFTLIETLIYAALTTAIITFAILATYSMIASADRGRHLRELAENQKFLTQKIYWALQSNSAINNPQPGATTTILSVDKIGYAGNPVVVDLLGSTTARIKIGAAAAQPITVDTIEVRDLSFRQLDLSWQKAIQIMATIFDYVASSSLDIDTIVIVK